jgi:hypothetical protein
MIVLLRTGSLQPPLAVRKTRCPWPSGQGIARSQTDPYLFGVGVVLSFGT